MSRTAYPTRNDLDVFLRAAGLVSTPQTSQQQMLGYDAAIAAAVTEWERATGWVPFLSGAPQTRSYDPPGPEQGPIGILTGVSNVGGGRKLFLNAGVRSITTLTTGVTPTSVGKVLTENTDYWLRPQNAGSYDRPFTFVEFSYYQWGNPKSIVIVAPFGFGTTVPDDAWLAILKMAALDLIPSLEAALTGGMANVKLGDDEFGFNPMVFKRQTDVWQAQVGAACGRYKRKVLA